MGADARMKKENRTLYKKQDRTGRKIGWILLVVLLVMSGCASEKKNRADGLTEVEFSTEDDGKASEEENDPGYREKTQQMRMEGIHRKECLAAVSQSPTG